MLTVHLSIFISVFNQINAQTVHEMATYMCDDTRGYLIQFWPPDDAHMCSKHVEAWNKTYCEKQKLCIKLLNYWDKWKISHNNSSFNSLALLRELIFWQPYCDDVASLMRQDSVNSGIWAPQIRGFCRGLFKNRPYQSTRCQTPEDWKL